MFRFVRAELMKSRRTFSAKLCLIAPVAALALTLAFLPGSIAQKSSYGWWYTLFLPCALSLLAVSSVSREKRQHYRGVLSLPTQLKRIWAGKLFACAGQLFLSCALFFVVSALYGVFVETSLPLFNNLSASLLLFATFLWQIPLLMFLGANCGLFVALIINMAGTLSFGIFLVDGPLWWTSPYSIAGRLMCPSAQVLPNCIPVPAGSPLLDTGVILPGVLLSIAWFIALSALTALWFSRKEAN